MSPISIARLSISHIDTIGAPQQILSITDNKSSNTPADNRGIDDATKTTDDSPISDHAERTRPEFWLEWTVTRESYVLEDELGPILFFKVHRLSLKAVELHIQFPPADSQHERIRIQAALVQGFHWLEGMLKLAKIEEVSFDSTSTRLVQFAEKRLGFRREGSKLHKAIEV